MLQPVTVSRSKPLSDPTLLIMAVALMGVALTGNPTVGAAILAGGGLLMLAASENPALGEQVFKGWW